MPQVRLAGAVSITRRLAAVWSVCVSMFLGGCVNAHFTVRQSSIDEQTYVAAFPWYAEFCALSEISKKPGFGAEIVPGGPGGHSVLYLNGVCRQKDHSYPVVALCSPTAIPGPGEGVGVSVNAHYSNANWIATDGRDFLLRGDLALGEPLTRKSYQRTQDKAKAKGILDGVVFHSEVFDDQPAGMSRLDFMYDMSVATDYAVSFGRDRYCARVPLDRTKMSAIVDYLNTVNAPYRSGEKVFNWNVLTNNCAHLAHNALAAAGVWPEWETDGPLLIAAFDFPVPKNEFVNLMRRTNDLPLLDPAALFDDKAARDSILRRGWLPTGPGGLAEAGRVIQRNEVYNTDLRLIFYDEPVFGHYQTWFDQIFSEPRYTDLRANLSYFSALYASILASPPSPNASPFDQAYYRLISAGRPKPDAAVRITPEIGHSS